MTAHTRTARSLALSLALLIVSAGALTACTQKASPGTIVLGEESAPKNFDPRFALDAYSSRINGLLYAGLVSRDTQAKLWPDLATGWSRPDERTYVFQLRDNLAFHDGTPLTAADVVYTFESIRDTRLLSPKADIYADLVTVSAQGERQVTFILRRPFAPFLDALTIGVIPSGAGRELARRPNGAGPFRLVDFDPGSRTTLAANKRYHQGAPEIRRLIIKAVPNDITRVLEVRKASVDILINSVPPDALKELAQNADVKVMRRPGLNASYLGFNLSDPLLARPKVRQAIAHAIDRERIIEHLLNGDCVTTATVLSPLLWAHAAGLPTHAYDPARARALLDEANLKDPDGDGPQPRARLEYKTSTNPLRRRIAEVIANQLSEIGLETDVRAYEFGTFFDDIKKGNFQLYSLTWVGIVEPDALFNMFHSESRPPSGANRGGYSNKRVDALLEKGRRASDETTRYGHYADAQRILATELPYITLWVQNDIAVVNRRIEGFEMYPGGDYRGLARVRLKAPPKVPPKVSK